MKIINKENIGKGKGFVQKEIYKKNLEEYFKNPKLCKSCKNPLSYLKRNDLFCNHSCAASFNNLGKRRNFSLGTKEEKKCLNCNTLSKNQKFCSLECSHEYHLKEREQKIRDNNKIFSEKDKKFLVKERGNKCEICNISEWLNKSILLILDHIDGNSDNWSLDNVRLICSNCDATLETYKSRNKGKGRDTKRRHYRQERYKNGSCN